MDVNLRLKLHMVATCPTYLILCSYFHMLACIVHVIFWQHIRGNRRHATKFLKNYQITLQPSAQTNIRDTRWHRVTLQPSAEPYISDTEWHGAIVASRSVTNIHQYTYFSAFHTMHKTTTTSTKTVIFFLVLLFSSISDFNMVSSSFISCIPSLTFCIASISKLGITSKCEKFWGSCRYSS